MWCCWRCEFCYVFDSCLRRWDKGYSPISLSVFARQGQALNQVSQLGYRGFFNVKVAFVLSQIARLVRIV